MPYLESALIAFGCGVFASIFYNFGKWVQRKEHENNRWGMKCMGCDFELESVDKDLLIRIMTIHRETAHGRTE